MTDQSSSPDNNEELVTQVKELLDAQLGGTFQNFEVVANPRYEGPMQQEPYLVVPFQVRAFNQTEPLAGLAPTGRSTVFQGVALRAPGTEWEIFADSLCILADLGVQIALRPPLREGPPQYGEDVAPTAEIAEDQEVHSTTP